MFDMGSHDLGVRILTNLAELELENPQFLRLLAFKLFSQGEKYSLLTIDILRRVLKMRPEEPHSYFYLAIALVQNANRILWKDENGDSGDLTGVLPIVPGLDAIDPLEISKKHYTEAISLFQKILLGKWDARFAQVEVSSVMEMNRMANYITFHGLYHQLLSLCDARFLSPINVDLRVFIMWDTDMTDVELEITEPSGKNATLSTTSHHLVE